MNEEFKNIYGVCDYDGSSWLFFGKEPTRTYTDRVWNAECEAYNISKKNIFPKNKPQKFKLIPIQDDKE